MKNAQIKAGLKKFLKYCAVDYAGMAERFNSWCIRRAAEENKYARLVERLRSIVPDISAQEARETRPSSRYIELKRRTLQAFQCSLMLGAVQSMPSGKITVVDIGDSAGTHMCYLKELTKGRFDIESTSINLDPRAVEKIRARGLKAVQCRAEEMDLRGERVDLFTSFQMVEHLHNPALFFRRLAKKFDCNKMLLTVPYVRHSRVGLHYTRQHTATSIFAEDEHIFELSPQDWSLLMLHSGWNVVQSAIYYQYPRKWPLLSGLLAGYWRMTDFEGFWGALLEKDTSVSDRYQDWEG